MDDILKIIQSELTNYESKSVEISEGVHRSAYKRLKRISFFENRGGEDEKINELGQYQFWLNPIKVYLDSTVKNLRIDTKNFLAYSYDPIGDFPAIFTLNIAMKNDLRDNGKDEQLKEDVEYFAGWGNILWEKTEDSYEPCDLKNTFIINQTAKSVNDSPVISRYQLTQSELISKKDVWDKDKIDKVIVDCKNKTFSATNKTTSEDTTNPIYEIYKRDGEISEEALFKAQGKKGGDKNKFILARVITAGLAKASTKDALILFAEPFGKKIMSDYYKEAHFGPYQGTWLREGLYETFFDYVVAIRDLDNDIQEGLSWASRVVFRSSDNKTFQNIRTDIENGRVIESADLSQVDVRLQNLDQLISRRNNLLEEMDKVAHSFDIIQGESMPSGTPFILANKLNENAGKYFIFIRQKLDIAYTHIYEEWQLPRIIKNIKLQDIIRITGDDNLIKQFRKMAVDSWYVNNLVKIGPHTTEMAEQIKAEKLAELEQYEPLIKNMKDIWNDVLKRTHITITGENTDIAEALTTIGSLVQFETDPQRRAYLLDKVYAIKGINMPEFPVQPTQQEVITK